MKITKKFVVTAATFLGLAITSAGFAQVPTSSPARWTSLGVLAKAQKAIDPAVCSYRLKTLTSPYSNYITLQPSIDEIGARFLEVACAIDEVLPDGGSCTKAQRKQVTSDFPAQNLSGLILAGLIPIDAFNLADFYVLNDKPAKLFGQVHLRVVQSVKYSTKGGRFVENFGNIDGFFSRSNDIITLQSNGPSAKLDTTKVALEELCFN